RGMSPVHAPAVPRPRPGPAPAPWHRTAAGRCGSSIALPGSRRAASGHGARASPCQKSGRGRNLSGASQTAAICESYPKVFVSEHWFELEPTPNGCRVRHGERFAGWLTVFMGKKTLEKTARIFALMNRDLKQRVEDVT
ncbi:MAG: hypothetical protein OXC14_08920, partial [Rhodospirillaceae bacterium]|nr:hypothetical protein [Rhodospirillaceae bacterium]